MPLRPRNIINAFIGFNPLSPLDFLDMAASLSGTFTRETGFDLGGLGIGNGGNAVFQATQWASAISGFYQSVTPVSATAISRVGPNAIMLGAMITANTPGMFLTSFMTGLQLSTTLIGVGMLSSSFIGIPPLTPLLLPFIMAAMAAGQAGAPQYAVYLLMASAISTWSYTGIAINIFTGVTTSWI